MDKTEYQIKLEQINNLVDARDYKGALAVVETIDWRRVKSVRTLCMVADIYEANKMLRESKEILVLAYHRAPIGKMILYRLVELSLKMKEFEEAVEYYTEYVENASNDNSKYILKYKIYRAKRAPIEEQIEILEKYKKWEYTERWAYELAKLYSRAGMIDKCIEECDDLILWFSEGKYVIKAMELKMQHQPLSPSQQEKYNRRNEMPEKQNRLIEKLEAAVGTAAKAGSVSSGLKEAKKQEEPEQAAGRAAMEVTEGLAAAVQEAMASRGLEEAAAAMETAGEPSGQESGPDMRNAQDIKEKFSQSFRDVLTRIRPENPAAEARQASPAEETEAPEAGGAAEDAGLGASETAEGAASEVAEASEMPEAEELPEVQEVEESSEAQEAEAFGMPEAEKLPEVQEAEEVPQAQELQEARKPENEADVDSILAAMASSMAAEIAAGEFRRVEPETVQEKEEEASEEVSLETSELPVKELEEEILDQETVLEKAIISQALSAVDGGEKEEKPLEETVQTEELSEGPRTEELTGSGEKVWTKELSHGDKAEEPEKGLEGATIRMPEIIRLPDIKEDPAEPKMIQEEKEPENRLLEKDKPEKMTEGQKKLFTYFVKVPGMDRQILEAIHGAYINTGDKTSKEGNIAIMGRPGTGKTRLSDALVKALCKELGMKAAKFASLEAENLNTGDPVEIVGNMSGGFLLIEKAGELTDETVEKLSQAMEFRTDSMILIAEDEKRKLQKLFANHPEFARKFSSTISIPVFTNDELVTFARTYSKEMGYKIDDMAVLALYTLIGDNQDDEQPVSIADVKDMVDKAITRASKKKLGRRRRIDENDRILLYEKDFDY